MQMINWFIGIFKKVLGRKGKQDNPMEMEDVGGHRAALVQSLRKR